MQNEQILNNGIHKIVSSVFWFIGLQLNHDLNLILCSSMKNVLSHFVKHLVWVLFNTLWELMKVTKHKKSLLILSSQNIHF